MFEVNDALYGLRNLSVGDEEEVRIGDYDPADLSPEALEHLEAGDYVEAYIAMIKATLAPLERLEVERLSRAWAIEFEAIEDDPEDDPDPTDLVAEMMAEYDSLFPSKGGSNV